MCIGLKVPRDCGGTWGRAQVEPYDSFCEGNQGCSSTCSSHVNQTRNSHHSEFIIGQCEKILSKANKNEIKCFDFGSIKRALRRHLRTIIAR